jgi:hypothetical protein
MITSSPVTEPVFVTVADTEITFWLALQPTGQAT